MSEHGPPDPGQPPTHRSYGDRSAESPFASPSGDAHAEPVGEQPTYEPYAAPQYGSPQPPAYGYGGPVLPDHPQATTALVLGLIALAGGFMCLLPLLAGPFAWVIGARARREIDQHHQYRGRDRATAGMVLGIVATGILGLFVLLMAGLVVLVAASAGS